jgi:hypothetical protein
LRRQELMLLRLHRELILLFALAQAAEEKKKNKTKCSGRAVTWGALAIK